MARMTCVLLSMLCLCLLAVTQACSKGEDPTAVQKEQLLQDLSAYPPPQQILIAAEYGQWDTVKALLEEYPQLIEIRTANGATLLHFAAAQKDMDLATYFLDCGVNPLAENESSLRASDIARQNDAPQKFIDFLIQAEMDASGMTQQ